jgi:hypothetical protein
MSGGQDYDFLIINVYKTAAATHASQILRFDDSPDGNDIWIFSVHVFFAPRDCLSR